MALTKENTLGRKAIRDIVKYAEVLGHVSSFPIKVVFVDFVDCFGHAELKGSGKKQYFELALDSKYMKTPHGRDLCMVVAIHELAHIYTWSGDPHVEEAKTLKYGDHGPEFGIVYAQLWTDLMEGYIPGVDEEEEEDD